MIVRFKELNNEQIYNICRGTIVLDYQQHPYVVVAENCRGWYIEDMTSNIPLNLINDFTPMFSPSEIESFIYIEKDDCVDFMNWSVIL